MTNGVADMVLNIYAAWIAILAGVLAGLVSGLYFHDENFLNGYTSWPRRLTRLGHVSFFGLGLLNLTMALTARNLGIADDLAVASWLMLVGLITMPVVCYISAFWKPFRNLFFVPVLSVTAGVAIFIWRLLSV